LLKLPAGGFDRSVGGRVDLFQCEEDHGPQGHSASRVGGQCDGGGALVVGKVDDRVHVALAEREVEALDLAAHTLGKIGDGVAPAGPTAL
jgi:hypothetical protein